MMRLRFAGLAARGRDAAACSCNVAGVGAGQEQAYRAPRTPDNTPDLSGIWQANNTANWDIEPHEARMGPVVALAAAFSVPPGLGVVEGDEIPYLPAALEKRNANRADWMKLDPEIKCYMPGIPRATYMPYPFQIVQSKDNVIFTYEFTSASRIVRMNSRRRVRRRRGWDGRSASGTASHWSSTSPITCPTRGSIAPATITAMR